MLSTGPDPSRDEVGALVPEVGTAAAGVAARPPDPVQDAEPGLGPRRRLPRSVTGLALAAVVVIAGAGLFLSGYSLGRQAGMTPGTPADEAGLFQPFWDAYRAVTEQYAGGPVDRQKLVEGAIGGMIGALGDPYSMYFSPDQLRQSLESVNGQFEGVGVQVDTEDAVGAKTSCSTLSRDCRLFVVAPLDGSPAARAGIQAGDVIASVDGASLDGLAVDEARNKIRGPKGSTVTLGIERGERHLSVEVVRDVIQQQEVTGRDLAGGKVGYLRLSGFSTAVPGELATQLEKDIAKGQRKLVLDLRGNPGGYVDAARAVASQFIASGPIFFLQNASGTKVETDATGRGLATDPSIQLVVLVDGGSASASEIVAGALHDRGRATLVGQKTFGKGTMQQWDQLGNDAGGFRLTIARWLTPNGTWVHGKGITPDVVVEPSKEAGIDAPLAKALQILGEGEALAPAA